MPQKLWITNEPAEGAFERLLSDGYSPLLARALASRGISSREEAERAYPLENEPFPDPFLMDGMEAAVSRISAAIEAGEHVAIYGDYDVDGITSVCLMVRYLRSRGLSPRHYIPSRIEEGYGLNTDAISTLRGEGVTLIITVDSGVTAAEEAAFAASLGVDMVITDHHECKLDLPAACAVINPRKPGCPYPFKHLAGVGVAFQLLRALEGEEKTEALLDEYADLVAIGTIADVMPLIGENRVIARRGLRAIERSKHPGVRALVKEAVTDGKPITSSVVGFSLAPRLNAAGRMGKATLAVDLLLSDRPDEAAEIAKALCELNRLRQATENEIFEEALEKAAAQMENPDEKPAFLVLAGERWHQGVVGIVASRISERFSLPVFLICLEGDEGKGSARSTAGIDIYSAMEFASKHLKTWGGHEYAAGFTIAKDDIGPFRDALADYARKHLGGERRPPELLLDGGVSARDITVEYVRDLDYLEPTGAGNPAPVFSLKNAEVSDIVSIGTGKSLRLRARAEGLEYTAFYFGVPPELLPVWEGDAADIAFKPELDTFRGRESVRLIIKDLRPEADESGRLEEELAAYRKFQSGENLTPDEARMLAPERPDFAALWRHIRRGAGKDGRYMAVFGVTARRLAREERHIAAYGKTLVVLDVLAESGLIAYEFDGEMLTVSFKDADKKADLQKSAILTKLRAMK